MVGHSPLSIISSYFYSAFNNYYFSEFYYYYYFFLSYYYYSIISKSSGLAGKLKNPPISNTIQYNIAKTLTAYLIKILLI